MTACPQGSHADHAALPCSILCDRQGDVLQSIFFERGNLLSLMPRGKFCILREFVSVGRILLILQTRKHAFI